MITNMIQLTIVGPLNSYLELLDTTWELDCLHLIDIDDIALDLIEIPSYIEESHRYKLEKLTSYQNFFKNYSDILLSSPNQMCDPAEVDEIIESLGEDLDVWKKEMAKIQDRLEIYNQYNDILSNFLDIVPELPKDGLLETLGIIMRDPSIKLKNALEAELEMSTDGIFQLNLHTISKKLVLGVLIFPKEFQSEIRRLLDDIHISELALPSMIQGTSLSDRLDKLQSEQTRMNLEKGQLLEQLQELYDVFQALEKYLDKARTDVAKLSGLCMFRRTEHFEVFSVFCDVDSVERVKEKFHRIHQVQVFEDPSDLTPPTKLKNPSGIKEFQLFTDLLPPLSAKSIDPTFLMAIFFPLFYGFIVGDIGYGIIITGLGGVVYHKNKSGKNETMKRLGGIFLISGMSSIFFGILYGEFFGNLAASFGISPLWFQRGHELMTLLIISIGIGVFHIMLGIALGIWNAAAVGHQKAKHGHLGMFLVFLGIGLLGISIVYEHLAFPISGGLLVTIGIFYLIKGEGIIGIIEIISTFANMLSYARLMALGAASVILADLANEMYYLGGGGVVGVLLAVLIHLLNIGIAMFSPTIHSMRLHLVEFFNKFLEYGENKYTPFGPNTQLS